jgi:hypothetical protein
LESQYSTLSWQIYGSDSGATVRIRFGESRHARRHCSQAEFSNASETTSCPQTIIKYKKLSQKQIERDSTRLQNFQKKKTGHEFDANQVIRESGDCSIKGNQDIRESGDCSIKGNQDICESGDCSIKGNQDIRESGECSIKGNAQTEGRILRSHKKAVSEMESVRGYDTELVDICVVSSPVSDISKNSLCMSENLVSPHSPDTKSPIQSQLSPLKVNCNISSDLCINEDTPSCSDLDLSSLFLPNLDVASADIIPVPLLPMSPPSPPVDATDAPPTISDEMQIVLDKINNKLSAISDTFQ